MQFDIVAGDRVRRSSIVEISDLIIEFALGEEIDAEPALPVTLLLAVFKFDRLEWAIEKATELGVETNRSRNRAPHREASRSSRRDASGALAAHRPRSGAAIAAIRHG